MVQEEVVQAEVMLVEMLVTVVLGMIEFEIVVV